MIDLADYQAVSVALEGVWGSQGINGQIINRFCPICCACIPAANNELHGINIHKGYHLAMAEALTSATEVAATIKSLTEGSP